MKTTFTLTKEHLKLLAHANVRWCTTEDGSPGVHSKKPYGSYEMLRDMHFILSGSRPGHPVEFSQELMDKYLKLHRETEFAMSILLQEQSQVVVGGTYEREHEILNWMLVDSPEVLVECVYSPTVTFKHKPDFSGEVLIQHANPDGSLTAKQVPFASFLGIVASGLRALSDYQLRAATDLQVASHELPVIEGELPRWSWCSPAGNPTIDRADVLHDFRGNSVVHFSRDDVEVTTLPLSAVRFLVRCYLEQCKTK